MLNGVKGEEIGYLVLQVVICIEYSSRSIHVHI